MLCMGVTLFAQTARLQVIHNSPTPTVDVYVNNDLLLDNFAYRTATPYIDVPAGVELNIGIALGTSVSVDDVLVNFPVTLAEGETYVAVAAGIVGGDPAFNLFVNDMGAETSDDPSNVGISFFHGSPDAPEVDVLANGGVLFDNTAFGGFAGYANVPASQYNLWVTPSEDNATIVAAYSADLSWWAGNTAVVFASGYLSGDFPAFEPWVALSNGGTFPLPATAIPDLTSKVQIIHNSPDAAAAEVDIYVGGDLLLDDFAYRAATPFVDVPVGTPVSVAIAPSTSTSVDDAIATYDLTFEAGKRYIAVANGLLGAAPAFNVDVFDMGREQGVNPDLFDLAFLHGSPDAPAVDIDARDVGTLVSNISYSEFRDYTSLAAKAYNLDIKPAGTSTIVTTLLADVSGLAGQAGIAIASGFLADDPAFAVIVVLADGTVVTLSAAQLARVQVIHNSPTPTVDIYANGDLFVNDLAYRNATPFVTVPAEVEINLGIALSNSQSVDEALANFPVTLANGGTYVVIANGIVGGDPAFNLEVFDMGRETASEAGNVDLLFFHGSPDAPTVDVTTGGNVLYDDVSYGEFSGYLSVPAASYTLDVTPGDDNSTIVATYQADFSWWVGNSAVVFASGNLSGDFPAFQPWVALSTGGTFPLPQVPGFAPSQDLRETAIANQNNTWKVFPNPASSNIQVQLDLEKEEDVQLSIINAAGQSIRSFQFGTLAKGFQSLDIDVSDLNTGLYLLKLDTALGSQTQLLTIGAK